MKVSLDTAIVKQSVEIANTSYVIFIKLFNYLILDNKRNHINSINLFQSSYLFAAIEVGLCSCVDVGWGDWL